MAADKAPKTETKEAIVEVKTDGFGSFGPMLNYYHFGDVLAVIGLFITAITYLQARSAKKAAQNAAKIAIKLRNQLESAGQLSELASNLRAIRDVYHSDNIVVLDLLKDRAVSIAADIRAAMSEDDEIVDLMIKLTEHLREPVSIVKDETKRRNQLQGMAKATIALADKVEILKSQRLKNGS